CDVFPAEDGLRAFHVTGVQTCALPIFEVLADEDALAGEGGVGHSEDGHGRFREVGARREWTAVSRLLSAGGHGGANRGALVVCCGEMVFAGGGGAVLPQVAPRYSLGCDNTAPPPSDSSRPEEQEQTRRPCWGQCRSLKHCPRLFSQAPVFFPGGCRVAWTPSEYRGATVQATRQPPLRSIRPYVST